jgi:hypothetical protein
LLIKTLRNNYQKNVNNLALSVLVLLLAVVATIVLSQRNTVTLDGILSSIKAMKNDEVSLDVIFTTIEAVRRESLALDP